MRPLLVPMLLLGLFVLPAPAQDDAAPATETGPTVQVLPLRGVYVDHPMPGGLDPSSLLFGGGQKQKSFFKLCDRIQALGEDQKTDAIFLDLASPVGLNLAQFAQLSRTLERFRAEGKKIYAWLENAGPLQYAIATNSDKILMADFGILDFPSLSMATLHFRDAMDLLGIRASMTRVGDFKGAVEPFTRSEMSDHLRAHYRRMLQSMNDAWVDHFAAARDLAPEHIRSAQGDRIFTAKAAKEAGLIDVLVPYGIERSMVANIMEHDDIVWREKKKRTSQPSFFEIMTRLMGGTPERRSKGPNLAMLHLDGAIIDGSKVEPGQMVSGPTVKAIEKLIEDEGVKGVVVRINSPGGSATASEAIRRALQRLAEKKPVAISMGNVAASGGYWITCIGKPIYAEPATITGSIGVFALKLSFGALLNRIGIRYQAITLDESASAMAPHRGWSDPELARIQTFVDDVYARFLENVAKSRGMTEEAVDAIAGGRVWSGIQAKSLGLVDHLGGTDVALRAVAEEAGLEPGYGVIHRPRHKPIFELFDIFSDDDMTDVFEPAAIALLGEAGFDIRPWIQLARSCFGDSAPRIWLLAPMQFRIR